MSHQFPHSSSTAAQKSMKESAEKKNHKSPFLEIAAAREEILRIDHQLEELRSVYAGVENPEDAEAEMEEELRLKSIDPMLQAMVNVELCSLAASGGTEEMRLLLENGANPNARDYDARSLLHISAMNGHVGVVEVLLAFGADPTPIDAHGKTPAEYAEMKGHTQITMLLSGFQSSFASPVTDMETPPSSSTSQCAPDFSSIPQPMVGSLVVIMVGLPGRGKSFVSRQICRYFQWNGQTSAIISTKKIRSEWTSTRRPVEKFLAVEVVRRVMQLITRSGGVAILDGSHETAAERNAIVREILKTGRIKIKRIIFVEVIINNPDIIHQNILHTRGYASAEDGDAFLKEYYKSIAACEEKYQTLNPITDVDLSYIRMEDTSVYSLNQISGWMPSRLAFMLHNVNPAPKPIYLTRCGEYVDLKQGRIGGNTGLTSRGVAYSTALLEYFTTELDSNSMLNVFCSCATRATQTSAPFSRIEKMEDNSLFTQKNDDCATVPASPDCLAANPHKVPFSCRVIYFPSLDDINHGDCEGMLFSEIKQTMPYTLQEMQADPYYTAWPNGECLHQVFNSRLEPHIHDIQASTSSVLVISHLPLLQGLHCYFTSTDDTDVANPQLAYKIKIPLECVIKIHIVDGVRVAKVVNLSKEVDKVLAQQSPADSAFASKNESTVSSSSEV